MKVPLYLDLEEIDLLLEIIKQERKYNKSKDLREIEGRLEDLAEFICDKVDSHIKEKDL